MNKNFVDYTRATIVGMMEIPLVDIPDEVKNLLNQYGADMGGGDLSIYNIDGLASAEERGVFDEIDGFSESELKMIWENNFIGGVRNLGLGLGSKAIKWLCVRA